LEGAVGVQEETDFVGLDQQVSSRCAGIASQRVSGGLDGVGWRSRGVSHPFRKGTRIGWGTLLLCECCCVGLEGGFCLGAIEGEGEVVRGVFEAVEMQLDQRVIASPEEGFN